MKTTLHVFLLAFCLPFLIISCGPDEGCTSKFATNYDEIAVEDCCCTYDVETLISELVGTYLYDGNNCSIQGNQQFFDIQENSNVKNGLLITNLFLIHAAKKIEVPGIFEDGVFKFEHSEDIGTCRMWSKTTLKFDNLGLGVSTKYFGTNNCGFQGLTCEGILTKT